MVDANNLANKFLFVVVRIFWNYMILLLVCCLHTDRRRNESELCCLMLMTMFYIRETQVFYLTTLFYFLRANWTFFIYFDTALHEMIFFCLVFYFKCVCGIWSINLALEKVFMHTYTRNVGKCVFWTLDDALLILGLWC